MQTYITEIHAIDPLDGNLRAWVGPRVPGISFADAEEYCRRNGLGYCRVVGRFIAEIPFDGSVDPSTIIDPHDN